MVRMLKWLAPAVAALGLVFAVSSSTTKAADEKPAATGGGTVAGTVVDKDGKAVEGASVRVMKPMPRGQRGGAPGGAAPKAADPADNKAPGDKAPGAGGAGGRQRPPAVAEGKTDKDGKFSLANVPAGEYMVAAMVQGKGFARGKVTVKDGETASVELKLEERAPGAGGRRPGNDAPPK